MPREVAGRSEGGADHRPAAGPEPGKRARTDALVQRKPAPDAAKAPGNDAGATGDDAMWRHVIGERSTAVGKLARVRAPHGVRFRTTPAAGSGDVGIAPFDELVQVERRTEHGWCWVIGMGEMAGRTGFCEEQFLSIDPPEPLAHLYRVEPGDRLADIAVRRYGADLRNRNQVRMYVQALYLANKGHAGVYLEDVDLSLRDMVGRGRAEIETVEVYKGAKVRAGLAIWVPSEAFIAQLAVAGQVSDGATAFTRARDAIAGMVTDLGDAALYGAGFTVGLLRGSWSAITDLFAGAAELIEVVAKTVYHVVTGNPGAVKDMLMGWVDKLSAAWANRDKIADEFMRKWEAEDGWDRGSFQGEVLGWVMMTALIALLTAGEGAAVMMTGRWAHVLRALKTVDALGDVTVYARKVGKLPAKAVEHVQERLGRGTARAERAAGRATDGVDASNTRAEPTPEATVDVSVVGRGQSPRMRWAKNPAGQVRAPSEVLELARRHGVEIPDDIRFFAVDAKRLPPDTFAQYMARDFRPGQLVRWEDLHNRFEEVAVKLSKDILDSDEAIVAVIAHEMHELNSLRRIMDESGGAIRAERLHNLISPGIKGNLHDQAWDVADEMVAKMRKGAP